LEAAYICHKAAAYLVEDDERLINTMVFSNATCAIDEGESAG